MKRLPGSVTVFFSLVFLLIAAILGTMAEGARVTAARSMMGRYATISLENILAQYNRGLWDDYHLFYVEMDMLGGKEGIKEKIDDYLDYAVNPERESGWDEKEAWIPKSDFMNIRMKSTQIIPGDYMSENGGKGFREQAVRYQRYASAEEALHLLMEKLGLIENNEKDAAAIQKKLQFEEKLSQLEINKSEIIEAVEGLVFKKGMLCKKKNGTPKVNQFFAKKLCFETVNQSGVGVKAEGVYRALAGEYIDGSTYITDLEELAQKLLAEKEDQEVKDHAVKDQESKKTESARRGDSITEGYGKKGVSGLLGTYLNSRKKFLNLVQKVLISTNTALDKIAVAKGKVMDAGVYIEEYERVLEQERSEIKFEVYNNLSDDFSNMKTYYGKEAAAEYSDMEMTLRKNAAVLEKIITLSLYDMSTTQNCRLALAVFQDIREALRNYTISSLQFDYGHFTLTESENPVSEFKNMFSDGLLGLLLDDTDAVSEGQISISIEHALYEGSGQGLQEDTDAGNIIAGCEDGYEEEAGNIFEGFKGFTLEKAEDILFRCYLQEHFNTWMDQTSDDRKDKTVLSYEAEYLLCGNLSDKNNLSGTLYRILLIRLITNFLYLLGDKEKNILAQQTALAIVGFTGLTPLVTLMKTILLLVWAVEESIIELRVLLNGGEIPVTKNNKTFTLEFYELFMCSRKLIKDKAEKMEGQKQSGICMDYNDYLFLLLLLTEAEGLSYRSMVLIEKNMQYRYSGQFSIADCISSITADVTTTVPSKFFQLPFVKEMLTQNIRGLKQNGSYTAAIN